MRTSSWVICEKATGRAICEVFSERLAAAVNTTKYEAVPVLRYLQQLNAQHNAR